MGKMDETDDIPYLMISGLQHFAFCRRQWALIHIEQQWRENLLTVEGTILHERAHDRAFTEKRGDRLIVRSLPVVSHQLRITGQCDVVEFHASPEGVPLKSRDGTWLPMPVEYKRGKPKEHDADRLQLCAQAMCLEEMLGCPEIKSAYLFYKETARREAVPLDEGLRGEVGRMLEEMHAHHRRGYTPKVKPSKACGNCSLKEECLPKLMKRPSVSDYMQARLGESDV